MAIPQSLNAAGAAIKHLSATDLNFAFLEAMTGNVDLYNEAIQELGVQISALTPAKIVDIALTNQLGQEHLEAALNVSTLTDEQKEEVLAAYASATAKGTDTAATNTLSFSVGNLTTALWANIKAMLAWLTTNPVGWCIIAAAAIGTVAGAYDLFTTSVDEHLKKLQELDGEYESNTSELESLQKEIETTNHRIAELESSKSLSLVEQSELIRLKDSNAELEREIVLLKQRNEELNCTPFVRQVW